MNRNYSLQTLRRKIRFLESYLDLDAMIDGEKNSESQIQSYYHINDAAYRKFHSQDGFMHFRISKTGTFTDEDVYYQPDTVGQFIHDGSRVLELGYGQGASIRYLGLSFPKARFYGVDLSHTLDPNTLTPNIHTVQQSFADLSRFPDNTFDVVYAMETIVHSTDKQTVFNEAYRVLKPGGIFVCYDYTLVNRFETYDSLVQKSIALTSKLGACAMIESSEEWNSYFAASGFQTVSYTDLAAYCLPDLKRLERKAAKILERPAIAKPMFRFLPEQFVGNIIIGYLGFDACNAGVGTYSEWICKK